MNTLESRLDRIELQNQGNQFKHAIDKITAIYKNSKSFKKYKDDIVLNTQKQICVKNKKCIIKSEIYEDIERIKNLFEMIIERRRLVKNG